jgi:ribosomal protein S18 acetylase RimI-like enzyme
LGFIKEEKPVALVLGWGERWVEGWVFHVKEMCICNDLQRQGLGTQLLSILEEQLATDGYTATYLQTGELAPARFFYEKLGYKKFSLVSLGKKLRSAS